MTEAEARYLDLGLIIRYVSSHVSQAVSGIPSPKQRCSSGLQDTFGFFWCLLDKSIPRFLLSMSPVTVAVLVMMMGSSNLLLDRS